MIGSFVVQLYRVTLVGWNRWLCFSVILALVCSFLIEVYILFIQYGESATPLGTLSCVTDLPVIIWWTSFAREENTIRTCNNNKKCLFTRNRNCHEKASNNRAYLFYGSNMNITNLPLPRNNAFWALLHEESPKNAPTLLDDHFLSLFNFTSTFSRYSHLPLTTQHLSSTQNLIDLKYYVTTAEKNRLLNSIAPVLYIQSNCDTLIDRDEFVADLNKYVKIDSYGRCLNNAELPKHIQGISSIAKEEFLQFVANYKFTITIENAICDDYITEKLWRSIYVGSVPIYFGSPSIRDWLPNYDSAVLVSEFNSTRKLAAFIKKLNEDDAHYEQFLRHKLRREMSNQFLRNTLRSRRWNGYDDLIDEFECRVCQILHGDEEITTKVDTTHLTCNEPTSMLTGQKNGDNHWGLILRSGRCQGQAVYNLLLKNESFTRKDVEQGTLLLMETNSC